MIAKQHKVFCSYAFTGLDPEQVRERLKLIAEAFSSASVEYYINLFDPKWRADSDPKECLDIALKEMETSDFVLAIMASERRSEGMLVEVGAAYAAGKKIILARHESADGKTYIDQLAEKTVNWKTNQDLVRIIKTLIVT